MKVHDELGGEMVCVRRARGADQFGLSILRSMVMLGREFGRAHGIVKILVFGLVGVKVEISMTCRIAGDATLERWYDTGTAKDPASL